MRTAVDRCYGNPLFAREIAIMLSAGHSGAPISAVGSPPASGTPQRVATPPARFLIPLVGPRGIRRHLGVVGAPFTDSRSTRM